MNAHKDFSKAVIKALKSQGIVVIGSTWLPDVNGDFTRGETGYKLNINGTSAIRTYLEVVKLAA